MIQLAQVLDHGIGGVNGSMKQIEFSVCCFQSPLELHGQTVLLQTKLTANDGGLTKQTEVDRGYVGVSALLRHNLRWY